MIAKLSGVVLLIVAAGLAWYGHQASQALASQLSHVLNGGPSDRVLMFYGGAAICALAGLWRLAK